MNCAFPRMFRLSLSLFLALFEPNLWRHIGNDLPQTRHLAGHFANVTLQLPHRTLGPNLKGSQKYHEVFSRLLILQELCSFTVHFRNENTSEVVLHLPIRYCFSNAPQANAYARRCAIPSGIDHIQTMVEAALHKLKTHLSLKKLYMFY